MSALQDDTIVAVSSGRPPAAIAVVRLSGPSAWPAMEALTGPLPRPRRASLRHLRDPLSGEPIDQGLVLLFPAKESATGEDIAEFQGHGGRAVVDAVLRAACALPGVRQAEAGEFTRRALANGKLDLTQAEGLADLLEAETESQRRAALARAEGSIRRMIDGWSERVVALSAAAEHSIDYAGEEDEAGALDLSDAGRVAGEMSKVLAEPRLERLRDGVRVVLHGPPNAGKSSLFNALLKQDRAIVTSVPGTTRDTIEAPIALGGIPFTLVDTAGLRESADVVERLGVERSVQEEERADIVLWLDRSDPPNDPRMVPLSAQSDRLEPVRGRLAVSALTGCGLSEVVDYLRRRAMSVLPPDGPSALTDREAVQLESARSNLVSVATERDMILAAERLRLAREALMRVTGAIGIEALIDEITRRFCVGK